MHFASSNELAAHIKSLVKQRRGSAIKRRWRRSRIHYSRNRAICHLRHARARGKSLFARINSFRSPSSIRDCDLYTALSIVNLLSRGKDPSFTRAEERSRWRFAVGERSWKRHQFRPRASRITRCNRFPISE